MANSETSRSQKRIRYRPGDYFLVPFDDGSAGAGRILLDMFRIVRKADWPPESPFMGMLGADLLVGYSRRLFPTTTIALSDLESEPMHLTQYVGHRDILHGKAPIIGHRPVSAEDIDFPEFLSNIGMKRFWDKGMVRVEVPVDVAPENVGLPTAALGVFGTLELLLKEGRSPAQFMDLRFSDQRERIMNAAGFRAGMTYDEMIGEDGWTVERILKLQRTVIPERGER